MAEVLHLDMDSYFATVEQQARPSLRGRPVGVAPVDSPGGTIVAASREAKQRGITTGTRIAEARLAAPDITIVVPTPEKYRSVHRRFRRIMAEYPGTLKPRSIDEIALYLDAQRRDRRPAQAIAKEIKQRIRDEVGEWLSSSVGIGANWLLAKTTSNFDKPDGLYAIGPHNIRATLAQLRLCDLCGIARQMEARFNLAGIAAPLELYDADPWELKRRLGVVGYYWHLRLHGGAIDERQWGVKSLGHSSVLPRPTVELPRLWPVLHKLVARTGRRLRAGGWSVRTIGVGGSLAGKRGWYWQSAAMSPSNDTGELFAQAKRLLQSLPPSEPLRVLAVRTTRLVPGHPEQLSLFSGSRPQRLAEAADLVNDKWGEHTLQLAGQLGATAADDSIAFGRDMTTSQEWPTT